MNIEIVYKTMVLGDKKSRDGLPLFEEIERQLEIKTKAVSSIKASSEALKKFYKWASDNKVSATVISIRFLDFV